MSLSRRFIGGNVGINTTNPTSTLDVSGTARITTSITSGALYATNSTITNVVGTMISAGTILATTFTGGSMGLSGDLVIGGTLTTVNITTTNVVDTNITSSNMNVTALATITNANITIGTVGTLINTNVVSTNVSSGTMNLSTGLTTGTILATTSISSGVVNATNSTVTNAVRTNISSGTLNLSTGLTAGTILATTSISSGVVNATNSTVTNAVSTTISAGSMTSTNIVTTNTTLSNLMLTEDGSITIDCIGSSRLALVKKNLSGPFFATNNNTSMFFTASNSATAGNPSANTYTTLMTITTRGNVGIGTTAPSAKLDVSGNLKATSIHLDAATVSDILGLTDTVNLTQTYIVFGQAGSTNDTAYLRQIGGDNAFKMAIDIHDDGDEPGFCIRSVKSTDNPDTINERFTVQASGNVGIGTSSPGYKLDVSGTARITTSITSGAVYATNSTITNLVVTSNTVTNMVATNVSSGTMNLSTGLTTGTILATTSLLATGNSNTLGSIFTTGGNVGIGNASPSFPLDVNGTIRNRSSINGANGASIENPNSGSSAYSILTLATDGVGNFNIFKNSTTRTSDGGANTTTIRNDGGALRLQSNTGMGIWVGSTGNVGINTTVPGSPLDVKGDSTWGLTRLAPTTSGGETAIGFFALNDFTASGQATSGNWLLGTGINSGGASNFNLLRNTTNMLTVVTNGNIGIGTTSPTAKLNVSGSTDLFGNLRVGSNSSSTGFNIDLGTSGVAGYRAGYLYGDGTTMYLTNQQNGGLNFGTNNTWDRLVINAAGNVGIGTASPSYKLEINTGTITNGNLMLTNAINGGVIAFNDIHHSIWGRRGHNGTVDTIQIREFGQIEFWTGGLIASQTQRMVIGADGNVGIGTASPGYKLDVNGSFATNTMLIRSTSYSTTLAYQVYNANTWYAAIAPGILTSDATYIVSLTFGCDGTPWNIYTSFLHMIGWTNDNQFLYTSGANVPTTIHANNSNGVDYQIKVRGSYAPNSSGGIEFSINGTTPSGSWTVKAYRII